jgi:hypothetical protein
MNDTLKLDPCLLFHYGSCYYQEQSNSLQMDKQKSSEAIGELLPLKGVSTCARAIFQRFAV